MPDEQDDQPDRDAPYMDPREYLTTRHIIEDRFGKPPLIPRANFDDAVRRIEIAVEVLGHQCNFTDEDLFELIRSWDKGGELRDPDVLTLLRADVRGQYLTGIIGDLIDDDGSFYSSAVNFETAKEALAALGPGLKTLPPLQTDDQFISFGHRVTELSRHHPPGLAGDIKYESRRIDVALVDIFEAFTLLGGHEQTQRNLGNDRGVANADDVRPHDGLGRRGTSTYPYGPPRNIVVSNVMERGDEIAKSAAESVEAMRIVLSTLEERRSNDPAESELKEQLAILIEKIGEARDATERATESGVIEDAEVAAETIEESKTVLDDAVRRMVDIGLNSAGAISCFAVALGATATFTAAGFAIPPLAALAVSAGFFGVSAVMDNLPGAKGTS
ncbi:hypothetical protein [Nisaea sediminum]|uniref:hypothetical protein n=4 Tax=Pseudomonadota TaxID=1224 RepID=UPI001867F9B6|nr:hypothetical protein [Nisaea sediminum]